MMRAAYARLMDEVLDEMTVKELEQLMGLCKWLIVQKEAEGLE
jgi:hypothetical protein